ncbi:MAG: hypothetical protein K9M84_04460 [Spirochaetia bacterium]|nr:hypothetical protein [Spirochaetia bacterium]
MIPFTFDISGVNKGCTLDHLDGGYGCIAHKDALANNWRVFDHTIDELLSTYASVSVVIDGGLKVST